MSARFSIGLASSPDTTRVDGTCDLSSFGHVSGVSIWTCLVGYIGIDEY